MMVYNKAQFAKAGITESPATLDQLLADGKALKEKAGVKYPFDLPLSIGEATFHCLVFVNHIVRPAIAALSCPTDRVR